MHYKLYNQTETSNKTLHKIINFCCPVKLDNFKVYVKYFNGGEFDGYANSDCRRIVVRINRKLHFPQCIFNKKLRKYGYTSNEMVRNRNELLTELIAHEIRHLWQFLISSQKFSDTITHTFHHNGTIYQTNIRIEKDACKYGSKMLLKWRKFIKNGN